MQVVAASAALAEVQAEKDAHVEEARRLEAEMQGQLDFLTDKSRDKATVQVRTRSHCSPSRAVYTRCPRSVAGFTIRWCQRCAAHAPAHGCRPRPRV